jgi:hypothetical protein
MIGMDETDVVGDFAEHSCNINRVYQRIKVELEAHELNSKGGNAEIWALVEFEIFDPDQPEPMTPPKRTKKWKKFDSESELSDFIRRDTGEPLTLPPYSLTPQQSSKIEEEAKKSVSQITEDFRRFRVKSEMARKQADAQIRDLQSNNVESAKRRIEGQDVVSRLFCPQNVADIRACVIVMHGTHVSSIGKRARTSTVGTFSFGAYEGRNGQSRGTMEGSL